MRPTPKAKLLPATPQADPAFTPWPPELAQAYRAAGYWQGVTLGQMLEERSRQTPQRLALVCAQRRWTYAELNRRADQFKHGLHGLGIGPGDAVVLQLPNVAEFFVACFALFRLGAWPVMALPAHRRSEMVHLCQLASAKAWILPDLEQGFDYRQLAREVQALAPSLQQVIVLGEALEFTPFSALYLADAPGGAQLAEPDAREVAFLQLSGGSTGLPKLIPRTHDDYFYSVRASASICQLNQDSKYLCVLPVAHNFPLSSPGTLGVLYAGGCVVLARHAAPDLAFALIEAEQITLTALVPPLLQVWLEAARTPGRRSQLASLHYVQVGGAPLAPALAQQVRPVLGCALQQVFGMAEGLVNYTRFDEAPELQLGTQGRPISPHDEVRVVDDDDHDLPDGSVGHLLTRGPYTIRGYYRAAAHNRHAFTAEGFYRTGDLVLRLPSGHVQVHGRAKDQINRGGDKVAAEEVEDHLQAHPGVLAAALVAMPDPFLGERSCAFIIRRDPQLKAAELNAFLRQRGMAPFKIPDRIEFTSHFPQTAVGKINKHQLRDEIARRLG